MLSYIRPRIPHFREYGLTFFDGYNHYSCIKNDAFSLSLSRLSCVYIYFFLFLSLPYLILSFSFSREIVILCQMLHAQIALGTAASHHTATRNFTIASGKR